MSRNWFENPLSALCGGVIGFFLGAAVVMVAYYIMDWMAR